MLKALLTFALSRRAIVLLGLLVLLGGGLVAFSKLNIEAYPNPAPVILEVTAQAPGLSAEEMERYYTIPLEVGLAVTPGIDVIRSTSFYGLSFVRVRFNYGIDYYFAKTQAAIALQQNVSLPNGVSANIQGSSLVGEIFRYQVVGPPNFGLTNLRTVQDWILERRLLTVQGVIQVVTWGKGRCPIARNILTYSESDNPSSPHHFDQTRLFSQKQWLVDRFCMPAILASPALQTTMLDGPRIIVEPRR